VGANRLHKIDAPASSDYLNDWNAQLFRIGRQKCILTTNKATLYSFVRLNVHKKDLANLNNFFIGSLLTQLEADELDNVTALNYWLDNFASITFCRTDNDKKVIESMNDLIHQLQVAIEHKVKYLAEPTDTLAGTYVNNMIMGLINYETPIERIKKTKNSA